MDKYEFEEALKAFCLEHGYQIAGTCSSEGIYGEITIHKVGDGEPGWRDWEDNIFNWAED